MAKAERTVEIPALSESDLRFALYVLRTRQDECRKVTEEFRGHEKAKRIGDRIEKIKLALGVNL